MTQHMKNLRQGKLVTRIFFGLQVDTAKIYQFRDKYALSTQLYGSHRRYVKISDNVIKRQWEQSHGCHSQRILKFADFFPEKGKISLTN